MRTLVLLLAVIISVSSASANELPQKEDAFDKLQTIGLFGACLVLMQRQLGRTDDELANDVDSLTFRLDTLYRAKWGTSLFDASRTFFGREPNAFIPVTAKTLKAEQHNIQQKLCDRVVEGVKSLFPPTR
jgi:hypothetical protein